MIESSESLFGDVTHVQTKMNEYLSSAYKSLDDPNSAQKHKLLLVQMAERMSPKQGILFAKIVLTHINRRSDILNKKAAGEKLTRSEESFLEGIQRMTDTT